MNRVCFVIIAAIAFAPTLALAGVNSSTTKNVERIDCSGLKLQGAVGLPGAGDHAYSLAGPCRQVLERYTDGKHSGSSEMSRAFIKVRGSWDSNTNRFSEYVTVEGAEGGEMTSAFKCASDPYITETLCSVDAHSNDTQWASLSNKAMLNSLPLGQGITNEDEATRSATSSAGAPPPPPPPPPAVSSDETDPPVVRMGTIRNMSAKSGSANVKGMGMMRAHRVQPKVPDLLQGATTNGPKPNRQAMTRFGTGWQDGEQVFWPSRKAGNSLELSVSVPTAGRYQLVVSFTTAADYGLVQMFLNRDAVGSIQNLYSSKIGMSGPVIVGEVNAVAGRNALTLWTVGKDQRSSGYFVGIDTVELIPIP